MVGCVRLDGSNWIAFDRSGSNSNSLSQSNRFYIRIIRIRTHDRTTTNLAALILADAEVEITADKLNTILSEAGVEGLEPIWVDLFAKAVSKKDLNELLTAFNVGAAPAGGAAAAAGGAAAASGDAAAEEEKVEEKEESDDDMGFGLFD